MMSVTRPSALVRLMRATLVGGIVVGTLDGLDAIVFFGLRGVAAYRIFQGIAAGLIGRGHSGAAIVALGVALHFLVATIIVFVFVLAAQPLRILTRHPIPFGMLYGIAAFFVMNLVVIPHSANPGTFPHGTVLINGLLIHAFGVGLPAAFAARSAR